MIMINNLVFELAVAAVFTLPQIIQAGPLSQSNTVFPVGSKLLPRVVNPDDCRLWATTNTWTTCKAFIAQYNVSLPNFYAMNPSVEYDCYSFAPGTSYCLRMRKSGLLPLHLNIRIMISSFKLSNHYGWPVWVTSSNKRDMRWLGVW